MRFLYTLLICAFVPLCFGFKTMTKTVNYQFNVPFEFEENRTVSDKDFAAALTGDWYMAKIKSIITITEENGEYVGKITWMKKPTNKRGKIKRDHRNPDPNKRNNRLDETLLMWGFQHEGGGVFSGGEIYNPSNGSTYSGKLSLVEKRKILAVRAYIGSPMFGKSIRLKRAK